MALKVIGAGLGRTGTHSLKVALERLTGEPCYHMVEVFQHMDHCPVWTAAANGDMPDWNSFLSGYGSAVDWPAAAFWKEMSDAIPEAIVVLSVRNPKEWWESASCTIFQAIGHMPDPSWQEMIQAIFSTRSPMDMSDPAACMSAFESHNDYVKCHVSTDRLVVWNVKDGWAPLCAALGVPVPNEPFPKTNTREEFLRRREREKSGEAKQGG
jgi:hypothetical protein